MSVSTPIFCCSAAVPVKTSQDNKLYNDPNRDLHDAIFSSFLAFAIRRQHSAELLALINGLTNSPPPSPPALEPPMIVPPFTLEALADNPLTPKTPYCIHLVSRHDFGPVYSHRYFACPANLEHDWVEISLVQWFAEGEPFKMKAEKWDVKCEGDARFFRLTLRPNLSMRYRELVFWGEGAEEGVEEEVVGEAFEGQIPEYLLAGQVGTAQGA